MLSKDPTAEASLKLIPESRHAVYKATKEGIRSLCTKEINQHFWIEDATNLLNTKFIFASNVPFSMKAADFYKLFEGISLKKVYLKSADSGTGHVGRGTLEFENEESMIKALFFNRYRFDNRYIHLTPSISSSKQEVARERSPKTTTPTGSNAASQWTRQTASTRGGKPRGRGGRGGSSRSSGSTTTSRAPPTHNEPVTELVVDNKWDVLLNDTDE
jgi:RNA recognition motif-containing protein